MFLQQIEHQTANGDHPLPLLQLQVPTTLSVLTPPPPTSSLHTFPYPQLLLPQPLSVTVKCSN